MEHPGHLEGMLDRDQRTAKLRFFNESDIKPVPKTYSFQDRAPNGSTPAKRHCYCPTRTKRSSISSTNSSHLACRNGYLLNTFQSVKNVLIVVCLTLLTLPSASSAPVDMERMNSRMKWVNPCDSNLGKASIQNTKNSEFNSSELSQIMKQASTALYVATNFTNSFTTQTFGMSTDDVHSNFKNHNMAWLGLELLGEKRFNQSIPEDQLKDLKIDDVLLGVYGILQRVAVGLEQITWDQKDNEDKFEEHFNNCELNLKTVLCELYDVIETHGLEMPADATRDIMSEDDRHMDSTGRKKRDWIIFRDYMNSLQFLEEALGHLSKDLTNSSES